MDFITISFSASTDMKATKTFDQILVPNIMQGKKFHTN